MEQSGDNALSQLLRSYFEYIVEPKVQAQCVIVLYVCHIKPVSHSAN